MGSPGLSAHVAYYFFCPIAYELRTADARVELYTDNAYLLSKNKRPLYRYRAAEGRGPIPHTAPSGLSEFRPETMRVLRVQPHREQPELNDRRLIYRRGRTKSGMDLSESR